MRPSIQVQLPLMLLLAGIIAIASLYQYILKLETDSNKAEATRGLKSAGTRLAGMSNYLLQQDHENALRMEVFLLGQFPDLTLAVVADGQDNILHATQASWEYRALAESPLAVASTLIPQARSTMSGRWGEFDKGRFLVGVFAFQMPVQQNDLNPRETGLVVMGIDQANSILAARRDALRIATIAGSALLLLVLLLWFALHRLLTRPVQALVRTTRAFSEGDYAASANISSANEMGELSSALDSFATTAIERQQAQARNLRLAHIVENSVNEVYVLDAGSFQFVHANRAARENLGYSEQEILELYPWHIVLGRTRQNIQELVGPLRDGSIEVATFETNHKRKNGSTYPVLTRVKYLRDQTPPVFSAIVQDISERRDQQAALMLRDRAIAEVDVGVLITDADPGRHHIVYANPAINRMTGYSNEDLIGRNPRILQGDDRDQPEIAVIREALVEQQPVQALLRNYHKDKSQFMCELSISPVRDNNGNTTHFIGIQRDVTDRLETEARLRQGQKIEAIGQLSGGIAHDFNNLLNVIIGHLEFLRMELKDPELLDYANEADAAANMGARLTRRLLAFARQSSLDPTIVNINDHAIAALELLQSTIGEKILLSSTLSPELWTTRADPSEIENTVVNLAINARDAMPNGGRIQIDTANVHLDETSVPHDAELTPGDYVKLTVSDNGTGMTEEVRERVFEPFFTTKAEGKGTGLGLASIYGFAKQSGGHITVESVVDKGTTFSLYLPRYTQADAPDSDDTPAPIEEKRTSRGTILVVEDNEMLRNLTIKQMHALGYATMAASDGPAALALLETETEIDLVLSDVVMDGGMSGYDIARWVHDNRPDCRILLTSGFSDQPEQHNQPDIANLQLLAKPYTLEELQQAIASVLMESSDNT